MFSFLRSERTKLRDTAKNWLYHAGKVYHFRKDKLSDSDLNKLLQLSEEVKAGMRDKSSESRLRSAIESLKSHMEHVGGNYYPRGSLAENVEFFFAAAIIYVGFTTFFVKPFKIPTNSMWPTYHGMTGEVYHEEKPAPGGLEKAFRFVAFGAKHYEVTAPADGELLIPMRSVGNGAYDLFQRPAKVKRYFVINAPGVEVPLYVGDERTSFTFPTDFSLEREVIQPLREQGVETPFDALPSRLDQRSVAGQVTEMVRDPRTGNHYPVTVFLVKTGRMVKEGETLLSFDLMTGDQLFVDRMSYHFTSPDLGDGFVFKTGQIPNLKEDKFYIKRLVGRPGDTVQIVDGGLMVNGEPAEGSIAFERNAKREGKYRGYTRMSGERVMLDLGNEVTVPEDAYLALGDNSYNSSDGRVWGFVPAESVVGRPIMIYYPFTSRFGLAE